MLKELEKHKVFVEQYKTEMVPYSAAKAIVEELEAKIALSTTKDLKSTLEDLKKDIAELYKTGKDITL